MAGINSSNGNEWEHMDEEAEQSLIRIMDEENCGRGEHHAPAASDLTAIFTSTFSAVPTPSEPEAGPADISPVVRRDYEEVDDGAVEQPRASSPPPGEEQPKVETIGEASSRKQRATLDVSNIVRTERAVENGDEEAGEENEEGEHGGRPVHEVSRHGGEATLTELNVLGGDHATEGCTCRPDVTGSTSGMEWATVDCCLYNRQRAQQNEREEVILHDEANKAVAGPSRQTDGQKCPFVIKKRRRETKPKLREEKKTKKGKVAATGQKEDTEIDVESIVKELNEYEEFCVQNKDDPTLRELIGVSQSDDDTVS